MNVEIGRALGQRRQDVAGENLGKLGVDPTAVGDIEAGEFDRVSFATVEQYCDAIGLDIELKERSA